MALTSVPAFGPQANPDGTVTFRLWAPSVETVAIEFTEHDGTLVQQPMRALSEGWFDITLRRPVGTLYRYVMPDGLRVPDPASRFQPQDVHGPSELIDPSSYPWRSAANFQRPWHEAIIYEIHVGTFTPEGTFAAAAQRLNHLAYLGITAIEIMPIADFTGARNWGYDGALLYAPDSTYGRPDDFKAFIDAAHERGFMVFLDVVYNHFGTDGNYLPVYACPFFTDRHKTPWGAAVNFDGPQARAVREFIIGNALYWLQEFRLDGLRLDAVHALLDESQPHILVELAQRLRAALPGVHLIIENEENEAHRLVRDPAGNPLEFTAQWNDDVHHVLHVVATGESQGYYADYAPPSNQLRRALAQGFAFQEEYMKSKGGARGEPSAHLPPSAFISFLQNHDQIGNRACGERLSTLTTHAALKALTAVCILMPQIPMIFMGEEWGALQPFPFFCDFHGELGDAVRIGRREEFAHNPEFQDKAVRIEIPDPQSIMTFNSAKLDWSDLSRRPHSDQLKWYRQLIALRREFIQPLLPHLTQGASYCPEWQPNVVEIHWRTSDGLTLKLLTNLSPQPCAGPDVAEVLPIFQSGVARHGTLSPWFVQWTILKHA